MSRYDAPFEKYAVQPETRDEESGMFQQWMNCEKFTYFLKEKNTGNDI